MIEVHPIPGAPAAPAASGYVRHGAALRAEGETRHLHVLVPEDAHPQSEDWLVLPALTYGMRRREDVRIHGRVSPRLLANLDAVQRILVADAETRRPLFPVRLEATEPVPTPRAEAGGTVALFSAGLDAFYTALTRDDVDALLYVHGQETTPDDREQLFLLLPHLKAAAAGLGKRLLLVDSDHWDLIWRDGGRTETSNHAMLAAVGMLLGSRVARLVVSASYLPEREYDRETGTGRLLPLLETEGLALELFGARPRSEKMSVVAASDLAMDHLRVCWARRGGDYNCGVCRKCLRTLVNLELAGALGRCRTLPRTLDLRAVARTPRDPWTRNDLQRENLRQAEAQGKTALAAALRASMEPLVDPLERLPRPLARLVKSFRHRARNRRRRRTREALERHRRETGGAHLFVSVPAATRPAHHPSWGEGDVD